MTTAIKTCFKCGEAKPLSDFYKHPQMADGHVNKCKECNKRDVIANRNDKVEYYREYDKKRSNDPKRIEGYVKNTKKFREENPEKYKAHCAVNNALRKGELVKPECCLFCGSTHHVVGHHAAYDYPLAVTWLCQVCHIRVHKETIKYQHSEQTLN